MRESVGWRVMYWCEEQVLPWIMIMLLIILAVLPVLLLSMLVLGDGV